MLDGHEAFHRQMLRIANLINSGDFDEAECLLNSPEPFLSVSNTLANAIMALDRAPGAIAPRSSPKV